MQRAKSKQTPEWGGLGNGSDDSKSDADPKEKKWRGVGEFEEDWGELNTGKRAPAVFVFDVVARSVTLGTLPDDHFSYGQPVWAPDGEHLAYVCWEHESSVFPRMKQKLGIVYCFNRHCVIKCCKWPNVQDSKILTPEHRSAFSPRFSSNGDLFFLSQDNAVRSGTHNATPSLHSLCRENFLLGMEETGVPKATSLVGTKNFKDSKKEFPGFYTTVLHHNPFVELGNKRYVWATVQWRSDLAVIAVDTESGQVIRASPDNGSSWSLLGITQRSILVLESNPGCPAKLHATRLTGEEQNLNALEWTSIMLPDLESYPASVAKSLQNIQHKTLRVEAHDSTENPINSFEATVIHCGEAKPTLLVPHGGPHTAYSSQFVMSISYLVTSGYNVITVNYRGSTGFGEDFVQSLPGNIGNQDVKDCYQALLRAKDEGLVSEEQIAVVGGSHGGFLSSHLIGQYPDVFKAAILRNPVCNISMMVHLTDIPDWCFIETYGSDEGLKRAQTCVSVEDLLNMENKSPVKYVENVKAPVLMMLGGGDRRVPMDDGKRYLARLKQRHDSPDSRLIVFDNDDHGLTKPQTEFEQWITALWWLKKFIHHD
jgi:acylaminoacyl-peptidase